MKAKIIVIILLRKCNPGGRISAPARVVTRIKHVLLSDFAHHRIKTYFKALICLGLSKLIISKRVDDNGENFSYHRFSGPVSGELKEVVYRKKNPKYKDIDFEAKPDYAYIYGIRDNDYGNSQTHKEVRDGDKVRGEYRVLQPDGMIRIVRYVADDVGGFKATVDYMPA